MSGGRLNAFLPIADPDTIPPAAVADLSPIEVDATRVRLRWTATGDDGTSGRPSRYDVRRTGAVARRKSDRPPAWDRPSYLRVVK